MDKKIFVVYASAGGGHKKAAISLAKALEDSGFKGTVKLIDSLDYTNSSFKNTYQKTYLMAMRKLQKIWGFFYYLLDNPVFYKFCVSWVRRIVNNINSKPLRKLILDEKPDLILSTHFLAPEIIGDMKKRGITDTKLVSVITDFRPHTFWINKGIDYFIVADQFTKEEMIRRGVDAGLIRVFGIPIDKTFSIDFNKDELRKKLGLKDKYTVLIGSGGWGVGPIEELVSILGDMKEDIQIIVVCGENKELCENINKITPNLKNFVKVYAFANNMFELMSVSDLMVTKSGGLTTSEALAKDLPMIVISPIPGQETRNCEFLLKSEAGFRADNVEKVKEKVSELLNHQSLLNKIKENIKRVKKPNSSFDIANFCIELLR